MINKKKKKKENEKREEGRMMGKRVRKLKQKREANGK